MAHAHCAMRVGRNGRRKRTRRRRSEALQGPPILSDPLRRGGEVVTAPPGLSDPFIKEVKMRDPGPESHGCQTGVTAKAGSHLHPRYKHMKDIRLFEGIISEQVRPDADQELFKN